MRIAIFGSGALGSLFAARLANVADVVMVGHWAAQLATVRQQGLTLVEMNGRSRTVPLIATNNPQAAAPVDVALVLVKSSQTARTAAAAAQVLAADGLAITLQNGLGNDAILAEKVGAARVVVAGTTAQAATMLVPGRVRHAGSGDTVLGAAGDTAVALQPFSDLLEQASIPTQISPAIDLTVWRKLAINAAINPLTALLHCTNGALLDTAWTRAAMMAAAAETAVVAQALAIPLTPTAAVEHAIAAAQATASNHSSMRQDVERGVATEIDAICGAIATIAATHDIPTPTNIALHTLIKQTEAGHPPTEQDVQRCLEELSID